jgi:MoxR-like ATPase
VLATQNPIEQEGTYPLPEAQLDRFMFIPVPQSVAEYAVGLVCATRPGNGDTHEQVARYVRWGAGPRASQYLALAGKVLAVLAGRFNVAREDIAAAAPLVLRHRLIVNYRAEADGVTTDSIVAAILAKN